MTYADEIAREHVEYRHLSGMAWVSIAEEADRCCVAAGIKSPASLSPYRHAPFWAVERAFAMAWQATQRGRVAA